MKAQQDVNDVPEIRDDYLAFGRPDFSQAEIDALEAVLRSGWVGMGEQTLAFEQELADYLCAPEVVTVNSCSSALFLALRVHDVGPGDEVICPSLTWHSTAAAALQLGAKPVFCDIDANTWCATRDTIKPLVSARTKAVIVVHYGGLAADVKGIREMLPDRVALIEDAAHAFGARYADGEPVGTYQSLACFSFYANKNLSTGDGGAIALADRGAAERLRSLRQMGLSSHAWNRYTSPTANLVPKLTELGYKMNLTDLQSGLGRVQLKRQEEFRIKRLALARRYTDEMPTLIPDVQLQADILTPGHARHLFAIGLPPAYSGQGRDNLLMALRERNIGAGIHYAPLHRMHFYADGDEVELEETDHLAGRLLSLPIGVTMTTSHVDYVLNHLDYLVGRDK